MNYAEKYDDESFLPQAYIRAVLLHDEESDSANPRNQILFFVALLLSSFALLALQDSGAQNRATASVAAPAATAPSVTTSEDILAFGIFPKE